MLKLERCIFCLIILVIRMVRIIPGFKRLVLSLKRFNFFCCLMKICSEFVVRVNFIEVFVDRRFGKALILFESTHKVRFKRHSVPVIKTFVFFVDHFGCKIHRTSIVFEGKEASLLTSVVFSFVFDQNLHVGCLHVYQVESLES